MFCATRDSIALVSSVSTIQVSLLPPPWEELTTREPLRRATRVSPPVVTRWRSRQDEGAQVHDAGAHSAVTATMVGTGGAVAG